MSLFTRAVPVALTLALAGTSMLVAPAQAADRSAGESIPQEDSYYPGKGDPGIDVLHYDLDLTWKKARRVLVGDAVLSFRATEDAAEFRLDLGSSLAVRDVRVDGSPTAYDHTGKDLVVTTPVLEDSTHTVRITYRGTPRPVHAPTTRADIAKVGMRVREDGQLRTMQEPFGAFTWYPVNDHPSDKALYDIEVSAPGDWVGVSNGTMTKRVNGKDRTMTRFHLAHPAASYLITLAVGPYVHRIDTGPHGLPLHFWVPRGDAARYMQVLRHTARDLRWLESKLGRYPFESAGAVMVPGNSAMETQTMVTYGRSRFLRYGRSAAREVMVHELVHQWYGDTVTPRDWTGLWQNEGMATYLQGRWSAEFTSATWRDWKGTFAFYNSYLREQEGAPAAYDRKKFGENCVYFCTAAMFERLRTKIGDDAFWSLVRRWPQRHEDSNADRLEYVDWAEAETGVELSAFLDKWLLSPVWPPAS